MSVVSLHKISKVFGFGGATNLALDNVSLEIKHGEFVAIMGPSGSGKTTLLNVIGLLDNPTSGDYKLMQEDVAEINAKGKATIRRNQIGFVFQSFNLLPNMNVLENVSLPMAYSGHSISKRQKLASDMLERLELRKLEYYMPNQLSGGQTQRAAIARALINVPRIIVADEPTGNLDSENSEVIMSLLKNINEQGNTILMVTHNPELTKYASRIIYMKDGEIRLDEALSTTEQVDLTQVQKKVSKEDKTRPKKKVEEKIAEEKAKETTDDTSEKSPIKKLEKASKKIAKKKSKKKAKK